MQFAKHLFTLSVKGRPLLYLSKNMRDTSKNSSSLSQWYCNKNNHLIKHPSVGMLSNCVRFCSQLSDVNEISEARDDKIVKTEDTSSEGIARKAVKQVDVETSIEYMQSNAYKITYGGVKVWIPYRRNFPGPFLPKLTRKTCIRRGMLSTGNPCPLCRDEYLVVHKRNTELLSQFIDPNTGEVISFKKTGVCQKKHKQLIIAVLQAYDEGYLETRVPFREYDYSDYMKQTS